MATDNKNTIAVKDEELDYKQDGLIKIQEADAKNNIELRTEMTKSLLNIFVKINGIVLLVVGIAIIIDTTLISQGLITANERLIDPKVIMTLITATTIQLGSVIFTISNYLFPKNK